MKLTARVMQLDGKPLASAKVDVLTTGRTLARGAVKNGALAVTANDPMPPVWGLSIDGRPILSFPVAASSDSIDLGELVIEPRGLPWPAFHAAEGRVFGAPRVVFAAPAAPLVAPAGAVAAPRAVPEIAVPLPAAPAATAPGAAASGTLSAIDFLKPVPLRVLFDSTTEQLAKAVDTSQNVRVTGATVTLRGLPAGSGDDLSLQFPSADLAKNVNGLSELSFALRPATAGPIIKTPPPPAAKLPELSGYTRELALRKLASAGLVATLASEVVTDGRAIGRIVRQVPKAGAPADPDVPVQLFIGKAEGAF